MDEQETPNLLGKTALVTGATSGIGFHTALGLARRGARVLTHGRSSRDCELAAQAIRSQVPGAEVVQLLADLGSLAQIRLMAEAVQALPEPLDILVNNAGLVRDHRSVTEDGIEMTFAVNHLAPFYISYLLQDQLKAATQARIVTVASQAHRSAKLDFKDLQASRSYSGGAAYSRSKLANILFTFELARRLQGSQVTANCVHPGAVRSGFARGEKGMVGTVYKLFGRFFLTPEQGAQASIYAASAAELTAASGKYLVKNQAIQASRTARDLDVARRLWSASEEILGISFLSLP
jgi:retinol dehydrogenase 12